LAVFGSFYGLYYVCGRENRRKKLKRRLNMEENIKENEALELQKAEYEAKIANLKLDFAVETALLRAGARNVKAAGALLDREKLSIDEEGRSCGLEEQIKALKENEETAFLFESNTQIKGLVPYESGDMLQDTEQMSYSRFCEIYGAQ